METALSDPVLTTLCSVCRTNPPRYKCPRCSLPYCSVPCNRRHRTRTGCSGIRDVTVFVPRNRLCTAAGIDRDYNFLQGIDVARAGAFKHVVDERRVLRANDVQARVLGEQEEPVPGDSTRPDKRKWPKGPKGSKKDMAPALVRHWQGEELVFAPARRAPGQAEQGASDASSSSSFSFRVRGICRRDGIELLSAPRGFVRQRENNTTVATTTTPTPGGGKVSEVHLNWQVEWLLYGGYTSVNGHAGENAKPTRILRRVLDNVPLYKAHTGLLAADLKAASTLVNEVDEEAESHKKHKKRQQQAKRRHRTPSAPFTNAFFFTDSVQDETGVWRPVTLVGMEGNDEDEAAGVAGDQFAFYLLRPRVSGIVHHAQAKELIPIDVADTLAAALSGRSVLEFPTIYVLPKTKALTQVLPTGHVLGSTERRVFEAPAEPMHDTDSRRAAGPVKRGQTGGGKNAPPAKKLKGTSGDDEDEDEVGDLLDAAGLESETSSSGEDSSEEEESGGEEGVDERDDEIDEEEEEEDGGLIDLPVLTLNGLGSGSSPAGGKHKLVVYDSWSEKSDD
ncbi:Box C/D snoRNA accumulation [Sporothrix epigloea]|uniref:Box C/D snoRNA accumulation n=1 Tax=Sporothrix epigloea TaxID=1892477 RepID=A0ABP0DID3_9PEZI